MPDPTAELETRVRTGLADLVAGGPAASSRHDAVSARAARHEQRFAQRRRLLAGTAAVAVFGGGTAWVLRRDGERRVAVGPAGSTDGAWGSIDLAPLSARVDPAVVWAGDRLIVWGGVVAGGADYLLHPDGAAWSPTSASWQSIADAPAGAIAGGFGLWDGREVLVGLIEGDANAPWNDQASEAEALYGIAAYDPAADTWRYVAPIPGDTDERLASARQGVLVQDGLLVAVRVALPGPTHDGDVVFIRSADGAARAVDPGPFAASPYPDASGEVALTAVGDLVVATPNWDLRPWVLDPATWTWRQAAAPPSASSLHLLPAVGLGDRALAFESGGPEGQPLWMFDPRADGPEAWSQREGNPFAAARWGYDPVWTGMELFVPGSGLRPRRRHVARGGPAAPRVGPPTDPGVTQRRAARCSCSGGRSTPARTRRRATATLVRTRSTAGSSPAVERPLLRSAARQADAAAVVSTTIGGKPSARTSSIPATPWRVRRATSSDSGVT